MVLPSGQGITDDYRDMEVEMKLDKVIEIKENRLGAKKPYYSEEIEEADRLSIEALKTVQYVRRNYPGVLVAPLPGETKD